MRIAGLDVRGEVGSKNKTSRFDLVIFEHKVHRLIIETKKKFPSPRNGRRWMMWKQLSRYASFGVPVILCVGMDQAVSLCSSFDISMYGSGTCIWWYDAKARTWRTDDGGDALALYA